MNKFPIVVLVITLISIALSGCVENPDTLEKPDTSSNEIVQIDPAITNKSCDNYSITITRVDNASICVQNNKDDSDFVYADVNSIEVEKLYHTTISGFNINGTVYSWEIDPGLISKSLHSYNYNTLSSLTNQEIIQIVKKFDEDQKRQAILAQKAEAQRISDLNNRTHVETVIIC